MKDAAFYNSSQYLLIRIEDLEQNLKDAKHNYNVAIEEKRREAIIFELELEVESIVRKLDYYKERLQESQQRNSGNDISVGTHLGK